MRFGVIHRVMTDSLAVLGLVALLASGELNPWVSGVTVVGLLVALFLPQRYRKPGFLRWAGVVAPLALLGTQVVRLVLGDDPIPVIVEFAAGLQVIRLATRRGAAHDQQVIILSLLHLIAGTVLGGGLSYALSFVGFLVLTPGALVLSHLRREVEGNYRQGARDRTGLPVDVPRILRSRRVIGRSFLLFTCVLSVPVFLFTAIIFLAFPRVGMSLLMVQPMRATRVVGFSERVDLGGVGKLRTDPTLAMRVSFDKLPEDAPVRLNLYLRGAVFDQYDGSTWSRTPDGRRGPEQMGTMIPLTRSADPTRDRRMRIDLEPIDPPVVFVPNDAVALGLVVRRGDLAMRVPQVFAGSYGELRYAGTEKGGLSYDVYLRADGEPSRDLLFRSELGRFLQTPPQLSPKVHELAKEIAGSEKSPFLVARAIETALRTRYRYDLESPSGAAKDPLYDFLFVSKRGHCEFYSTAMTMMLRTLGVPSRNATGFVGGTLNRFGDFYAVRQGDAHSWVEAYLPGRGWTRFDPTPPSNATPQGESTGFVAFAREVVEAAAQRWNEHVIGYSLDKQIGYLRAMRQKWRQFSPPETREHAPVDKKKIFVWVAACAAGVVLVVWWQRRRAGRRPAGEGELELAKSAARPIELYRRLEGVLAVCGVARPRSTPPLLHAQALLAAGHPTGPETLSLTELYLRARFGGVPLSDAEERDFVRRTKALRTLRPKTSGDDDSSRAAA